MDKVRSSELHGELGYSYADRANYAQYLYEQEMNRIELNHYVSTCLCLSEGASVEKTLNNIHAINEAISDKVSNAWDKLLDFLKRMWGKFTESLNSIISNNNEYLERYKEIILKKPVKFCNEIVMNNLTKATQRIIQTDVEVINSAKLDKLPDTEEDTAKINEVRNMLVREWQNGANKQNNPEGKEFVEWLKDYFKAQDDEVTIAAQNFNMTDAYNFCRDFKAIKSALEKDYNSIQKSSNEFIAEIKKIQSEIKAGAAANTNTNAQIKKNIEPTGEAEEEEGKPKTTEQKESSSVDSLVKSYLHEFEAKGPNTANSSENNTAGTANTGTTAKSNIATTTNNKLDDKGREEAKGLAIAHDEKAVEKMQTKAKIYIGIGQNISTAKMTAVEFINREYMGIIKAHVAYYVGREKIEPSQQTKAGTDFSQGNPKAQGQNAQAKPAAQGEGARLSSDETGVLTEGAWQQFLVFTLGPVGAVGWMTAAISYIQNVARDRKYGKAVSASIEKTVAKAKRENRNLTERIPSGAWEEIKANFKVSFGTLDVFGYMDTNPNLIDATFIPVANKYKVAIIHDTNSIKSVKVCLYDKEKETAKWFLVPAPDTYAEK